MESEVRTIIFYIFAASAVVSAIFVVTKRNPVASAMNLVVTFFSISVIYILLNSQFIAVMQVLVYTGAIMVLILFVIMLLNLRASEFRMTGAVVSRGAAVVILVAVMAALLIVIIYSGHAGDVKGGITPAVISETGSVQIIARAMFSDYLLPFELVSLLITAAIIGAVVLSHGGIKEKIKGEE